MLLSVVLSQATPKPAIEPVTSVWGFAIKGGMIMIPLGLLSVIALAIIIERLVLLRRSRGMPTALLDSVRAALPNRRRALDVCRASSAPGAAVLGAALRNLDESQDR